MSLHVVGQAPCPVVVVHEGQGDVDADGPVVVGLDDSADAPDVLRAALAEAARLGAEVLAVTAYEQGNDWSDVASTGAPSTAPMRDHLQGRIDAVVEQVRRGAAGEGLPVVRTELVEGSAYDVLPERGRGAKLLVVGRRGHSAVPRVMLGSVALHAVVRTSCPVMVVHPAAVPSPANAAPVAG